MHSKSPLPGIQVLSNPLERKQDTSRVKLHYIAKVNRFSRYHSGPKSADFELKGRLTWVGGPDLIRWVFLKAGLGISGAQRRVDYPAGHEEGNEPP